MAESPPVPCPACGADLVIALPSSAKTPRLDDAVRPRPREAGVRLPVGDAVLDALQEWRRAKAAEAGLPPFRILPNRALLALRERNPRTYWELLRVPGIGPVTVERHGETLLALLAAAGTSPPAAAQPGDDAGA